MKQYYYLDETGEVQGPLSIEELSSMHRSGQITSATQVCEKGSENWKPYVRAKSPASFRTTSPESQLPNNDLPSIKDETQLSKIEILEQHLQPAEFQGITKKQGTILIVMLLIGLGAPFWVLLKPTPKWEYQTVAILAESSSAALLDENYEKLAYKTVPDISSRLESAGAQGWELVGTFLEHETSHPNFGKDNYVTGLQPNTRPQKLVLIFKRQKH